MPIVETDPGRDCPRCARLVAFREAARTREPSWHNAPVPSFGPSSARLLIVGLAPGLRGANRTGRPFTGDFAGDLLYETLLAFGFAEGAYAADPNDGLRLIDAMVTNAVRCVPPENKPTPAEITSCRPYLDAVIASLPALTAIVALGRIAHDSTVRALGGLAARFPFGHGKRHDFPGAKGAPLALIDSYHCSRYNTNTRVLTPDMFRAVFSQTRALLDASNSKQLAP